MMTIANTSKVDERVDHSRVRMGKIWVRIPIAATLSMGLEGFDGD